MTEHGSQPRPESGLPRRRRDIRVAIVSAMLFVPACDTFFGVSGRVTDCGTGAALQGVIIDLNVDRGFQHRMESLRDVAESNADGKFEFDINDPGDSWATLTLHRPSYVSLTPPQLRGHSSQDPPVDLCLELSATP